MKERNEKWRVWVAVTLLGIITLMGILENIQFVKIVGNQERIVGNQVVIIKGLTTISSFLERHEGNTEATMDSIVTWTLDLKRRVRDLEGAR